MKMKTKRKNLVWMALLAFLLAPLSLRAQSVTVSPQTGNLIAALSQASTEVGFQRGWRAMWRHEQLAMNFVTGDNPKLTEGGELAVPAGNMNYKTTDGVEQLILIGGSIDDSYFVLSLPKGYRFKGYKIEFLNNMNGTTYANFTFSSATKTFKEHPSMVSGDTLTMNKDVVLATTGQMSSSNESTVYTIERNSMSADDMGNQLYFHLERGSSNAFCALTVKSFTVYFTAEGTFEAPITSASPDVNKRSMVSAPFKTNKIDIGAIQPRTFGSGSSAVTFYAYTYANVRDLDAYAYIYQNDAVQDGIPMDVATTKKISAVTVDDKEYFAFENGVYYVEPPTLVYSQTGLSYPIGFRVVGAKLTPQWGSSVTGGTETRTNYYITFNSGGTTYYLNDQLRFTTTKFAWSYDSSNGAVFTGSGDNIRYLACQGSGSTRTLSFSSQPPSNSSSNPGYYDLIVYTRDGVTYIGWDSDDSYYRYYLRGTTSASTTPSVVRRGYSSIQNPAEWTIEVETVTHPSFTPGSYTLKVYDKTGQTVVGSASVSSASNAGTAIEWHEYNNDAVKFEISGLEEGKQALVDVSIFMQALNPYIDKMEVTCHDGDNQLSLSQEFDAADFKVSGGVFNFYIPSAYASKDLTFSFENLWSQYGDQTYYTGTDKERSGYARYSFVTSTYFEPIDLNGDNGLYDNAYSPDASYVNKVKATKAGNIRFMFNNAEELDSESGATTTNYLKENPFTVANYIGSTDPDHTGTGTAETGDFIDCILNATDNHSDIYYLFVSDETRYNIAPSTAWQHRYYAFYRMDISLATQTYDPKLTWTKVYDKTCYIKNGAETNESMWGLKLQTVLKGTNTPVEGYMNVKDIDDAITADLGKTNCPTTADQILYVDGSELYSIINSTVTTTPTDGSDPVTTTMTLETLKDRVATNALFYLPSRTTTTLDNFASKTTGGGFRANKDIVITDKEPFFAPYNITVDVDNRAYYERLVTLNKYGKVQNASLIMPFKVLVDEATGVHTNVDGTSFSLHTMQSGNSLAVKDEQLTAYFPTLDKVTMTEANKPYMVKLEDNQVPASDKDYSFVVSQSGAPIVATSGMNSDYTYTSTASTGSVTTGEAQGNYTFTPTGTYAGKYVPKDDNIFYFAKNLFWSSKDLNRPNVSIYPFRAYYKTQSTSRVSPTSLQVFFGTNEDEMEDAIRDLKEKNMDMSLRAGKGTITVAAAEDCNVRINGINGISRHNLDMNAGETRTISVPAGVYVVNGVKILVK